MTRATVLAASLGAACLALAALLAAVLGDAFMPAYLASFLFAGLLPVGALGPLLLIDASGLVTPIAPPLRAVARLVPVASIAILPILVAPGAVFPWTHGVRPDAPLAGAWLTTPFVIVRALVYLAIWSAIALLFARPPATPERRRPAALLALAVHLTITQLAVTDWMMSLDPHWHSSELGLLMAAAAAASSLAAASLLLPRRPDPRLAQPFLVALAAASFLWGSAQFFAFLTTWSADLPVEVSRYAARDGGLGRAAEWFGAVAGFAVPVLVPVLLPRPGRLLLPVAVLVLLTHAIETLWFVLPTRSGTLLPGPVDILVPAGLTLLLASMALRTPTPRLEADVRHA